MSKVCLKCGREVDDNAKFCLFCGASFSEAPENGGEDKENEGKNFENAENGGADGEKIGAEWQGKDCRCFGNALPSESGGKYGNLYTSSSRGEMRNLSPEEYEARRKEWNAAARTARALNRRKALFVLAFAGLLLDFICGIGVFLCLPVAIVASVDSRRLFAAEKRTSAQLVWAAVVGYVGAALGLIFIVLMF